MRLFATVVLSAALLAALPLQAAEKSPPPPASAPDDDAGLRRAETLGARLFELDRAAFVASDALMAAARGRADPRVQGWITEAHGDGIDVIFVDATPSALYRVSVDAKGEPAGPVDAAPAPLSPTQIAAVQARAVGLASAPESCSGFYNPVVMPGAAPGDWVVYLLPGSPDPSVVPLGGAWRVEVHDGQAGARRAFSQSCIALDNGDEGDAFVVTHLLDPIPTEIHVFWSLWAGKPMYVSAGPRLWAIEEGHIRAAQQAPATAVPDRAPLP